MSQRKLLLLVSCLAIGLCHPVVAQPAQESPAPIETPAQAEALAEAEGLNEQVVRLYQQGKYSEAIELAERVLAIRKEILEPDHPSVATSLNNLAALYRSMGRYAKAEPLYQQSLAIRKQQLGPDHPHVATSLNNLALFYQSMGRYAEAEPLYQQALAIDKQQLGPDHPDLAIDLNNLAGLYQSMGRYAEAEPLYQQSLAIKEQQLGPDHPDLATSLNNLAGLHWAREQPQLAVPLFQQSLAIEEANLRRNLVMGSEAQKQQYLDTIDHSTDLAISVHLQGASDNDAAARLALETILRRKGRLLELLRTNQEQLRQQLDPTSQELLSQLIEAYSQLSNIQFRSQGLLDPEQREQTYQQLKGRIAELEAQISRHSASFSEACEPVTLAQIQALLPADTALIEFIRYTPFNPKQGGRGSWGQPRYGAYILTSEGKVAGVDLGEAAAIEEQLLFELGLTFDKNTPLAQVNVSSTGLKDSRRESR